MSAPVTEMIAKLAATEARIEAALAKGPAASRCAELTAAAAEVREAKAGLIEVQIAALNPFRTAVAEQRQRQDRRAELVAGVVEGGVVEGGREPIYFGFGHADRGES